MGSEFLLRRVHSITGIVPVGLFLIYHLYLQLYLHSGAEAYNAEVNSFYDSPLSTILLVLFVYFPLIFHSVYGVVLSARLADIPEVHAQTQYSYFANFLYWMQRLSGVGVFFFIGGHLYFAKIEPFLNDDFGAHYEHLQAGFLNPDSGWLTLSVYIFGILGAAFHMGNGINTFCMTWGIALTPISQKMVRAFSIAVFVFLAFTGYYSITVFWLT